MLFRSAYGCDRHPISDLGGVLLWIENFEEWEEASTVFGIKKGMEEFEEVCEVTEQGKVVELLFQISSDYAVVVFSSCNNLP